MGSCLEEEVMSNSLTNLLVEALPGHFFVSWDQPHHIDFDCVEVAWWCPALRSCDSQCLYYSTLFVDASEVPPGTLYVIAARVLLLEQSGPWTIETVKTISSGTQVDSPKAIISVIMSQLVELRVALGYPNEL